MTLLFIASGTAWAQGVGNAGSLPGPIIPLTTPNMWVITNSAGGPVPVVRDPNGPPWRKLLGEMSGSPLLAVPGQTFTLHESLLVAGNLPWSDWHEKVTNPFWDWSNPQITVNGASPAGLTIINNPGNAATGGGLNFLFNAIAPGSIVDITKDLTYNGPAGAVFLGYVEVNQFPTPEPSSLLLLGTSTLLFKRRRGVTANIG